MANMCEFIVKNILISLILKEILGEEDVISTTSSSRTKREPPTNFLPPKPQYGPPKPQYGQPTPQYGTPTPQYGPPKPQYGPPSTQHGVPQNQYGPPSTQYGVPQTQYGIPQIQYGVPQDRYGPPSNQYGSPPDQYGPPKPQYGLPQNQYGIPQLYVPPKEFYGLPNFEAPTLIYKQLMLYSFPRPYLDQVPLLSKSYFKETPSSIYGYKSIFPRTMPSFRYSQLESAYSSPQTVFTPLPAVFTGPPNFPYSSEKYYDSFGYPSYDYEEEQSNLNYVESSSSYDTPGAITSYGTSAVNHRNPARHQNDVDVENTFSNVDVKFAAKPNSTVEVKTTSGNKSPHD